ncbi:hypothetical protein K437DRAFT_271851 [Tilletiaria anomala UBC 951]|uniref:Mitochondrial carrier n=1 Tax=Tilletiaria anomala (strain ATCC 24038 / CBS 436.72 / UBC 951) TaxID=1037660 RepID=A0A066WPX6_TILAU|nr:uncharacterized protein K437DRAFT_271851 [Tilletiaria anomala UBC 951]KDN53059.1 hypothetical protein K437DRAFT_271851 [Tilletiaria anomala UBC 951]
MSSTTVSIPKTSGDAPNSFPSPAKPKKRRLRGSIGVEDGSRSDSFVSALTRSLLGVVALFFRAPIRLYRPVKLSSWIILESLARREGKQLSLRYVRALIRREKASFIPHLLGPPLIANTLIGFTLFESFTLMESHLLNRYYPTRPDVQRDSAGRRIPQWSPLWITAVSGAVAGSAQCIISAPLDNVRTVLAAMPAVGRHHASHQATRVSWRAVARAAILPFAPELSRYKLVEQVKVDSPKARWSWLNPWNKEDPATAKQRKELWQAQLKRWRGGVHGAGLLLSLVRDSIGFSSFFAIFEISRRVAYSASISVDKTYAFFNQGVALPVGIDKRASREVDDGDIAIEDARSDDSFQASRTIPGRLLAAFILICGGAIGAMSYELLGRPSELMREVIWQGRKAWEEEKSKPKFTPAAQARKQRNAKTGHGRSAVRGARAVRAAEGAAELSGRNTLIEMRQTNTAGDLSARVSSLRGRLGPPHRPRRSSPHARHAPNGTAVVPTPHVRRAKQLREALHGRPGRFIPTLENRPSAWQLLKGHALRASTLRLPPLSPKAHLNPTPAPLPMLLVQTYFVAPFFPHKHDSYAEGGAARRKGKDTPERALRRRWMLRNPVNMSAAPEAYRGNNGGLSERLPGSIKSPSSSMWGSGRVGWALRRLATPYGIGFVAFAYFAGDLGS